MKALVLAAGFGTRLGAITTETPKPLLDVAGRPLVGWVLTNLAAHGIVDVAVNLHFRPEAVREALGDGSRFGVRITYLEEPELLGTAGAVANLRRFAGDTDHFLVHYGDVITDHDLGAFAAAHRAGGALATILVHRRARANSIVSVDADGRVTRFVERPAGNEAVDTGGAWVFSGVVACSTELIDRAPAAGDLPRDVFPALAAEGLLRAEPLAGYRCAVDSPERLEQVRADAAAGRIR